MDANATIYQLGKCQFSSPIPLVKRPVWDALIESKEVCIFMAQDGYAIGTKRDGSLIAVRGIFIDEFNTHIDVADAITEAEFLQNAEAAWRKRHCDGSD